METKKKVSFLDFRDYFQPFGYFSTNQVRIWNEDFDRNNIGRWVKQGKIILLRQGYYSFPSLLSQPDITFYLANKIYSPSYISLETAFSFYGMIPEGVVSVTSVTSRKTQSFKNPFGTFSYRTLRPELFFGFLPETSRLSENWNVMIATPEKALLDFLYLNSHYSTADDIAELRLDVDFMSEIFDESRFDSYVARYNSKALAKRASLLKGVYL